MLVRLMNASLTIPALDSRIGARPRLLATQRDCLCFQVLLSRDPALVLTRATAAPSPFFLPIPCDPCCMQRAL